MFETLEPTWKQLLMSELERPYVCTLTTAVETAYTNSVIYPSKDELFTAFTLCPFSSTKVVILGQDPYHGAGQAHGLSFSVRPGVAIPPSLRNIYKEIMDDIGTQTERDGNLEPWATQGVLLLNSTLTVEEGKPGSHQQFGWEQFTDAVIKKLSNEKEHVVFLLWGKFAEAKKSLIDTNKHLVLKAPHPSPLSAYTGFFGCKHFSQTNAYLTQHGQSPIRW